MNNSSTDQPVLRTYRKMTYLPLKIAKAYLLENNKAISKIKTCWVDFDDFPLSLNGVINMNYEIKLECCADITPDGLSTLINQIEFKNDGLFEIEMQYDAEEEHSLIYPKDQRMNFPERFTFIGEVTQDNIHVLRKEVVSIAKRWNLYIDDNVLDTIYETDDSTSSDDQLQSDFNSKYNQQDSYEDTSDTDYKKSNKVDNRKNRHFNAREQILGAAFVLAVYQHDKIRNQHNRITAEHIRDLIALNSHTFWGDNLNHNLVLDPDTGMPIYREARNLLSEFLRKWPEHNPRTSLE